ncbi:MAG: translin [Acidimicrobiaceae bacterium]|nr:translin [Acidimicrobiaceae bacterium]
MAAELGGLLEPLLARLDAAHRAREQGLAACRRTIRACGQAIRAIHRSQPDLVASFTADAETALREAQAVLRPHPSVAYAGFLHDAEKEYVEALLTAALVAGSPLPSMEEIGVEPASWLKGLTEAASELRRHLLDRLRAGELARGEALLLQMEDVYDQLVTVDYPDALTGGLRRSVDALRAVLERSRADVTTTVLQSRLQASLDRATGTASATP